VSNGMFVPSLEDPVVKVVSTEDRAIYIISWPVAAGATGYRVYGGFDPLHIRSLISGSAALPSTQTSFEFKAPAYPPGQIVYFWVKAEGPSPRFLDEYGTYLLRSMQYGSFTDDATRFSDTTNNLIVTSDQKYYMEEIRRRAKGILEDTGEYADLFIKQWRGLPDPTTQDELGLDPNYQAMTRSDKTYGVGFYPGFFPAIRIRIRFGGLPVAQLDYQLPGLRPLLENEAWTNWDPIVHENDVFVRVSTGQRYVARSVAFSNYRGVPITQRITLEIVTPTSPLQKITDADVRAKWGLVNSVDYLRAGFGVASDPGGGPDYIIFS